MAEALGTVADLRRALDAGETTSTALVERSLARAAAQEPLGAFVSMRAEAALREAAACDARLRASGARSPLDGVPIALKDNIAQQGEPCGCASRILAGYVSPFDATAVARLRASGAIVVGRANMDEFAMGSSTEHSCHGPTRNPWDPTRSPGGSSGGPAAAVAAGIVPLAFGSDTGGSIRQPASFTGIAGLKPTYGRVSRYGLVAFASSLDQIGPLARTAADCAAALDVISGRDACDSTSLPEPATRAADALTGDVAGQTIGLPREYLGGAGCDPEVARAVEDGARELEKAGATLRPVSLPHTRLAVATYYLICTAEASSNLARFDGVRYGRRAPGAASLTEMYERSRSEGFGREVKRRILLGTYVLSAGYYDAYYRKAQQVRALLRRDFAEAFAQCDVLVTPTAPETAFAIGERTEDPLKMYLSDVFTVSVNLAGVPAISVPCGFARRLPIGLQLIGRPGADATVLRIADAFQRRTGHHLRRPELA
ncbi:MAG TPA: Asp-tRNA(Asn)/Glu-tRNA(Gln) amidotransferase subunit GatA [Myxococcota bacterium]|nr:Asp-tRNA(Asn)/Glu-tRNA(Gln) amidotransferase subunit GatA [Myxococcota bacterium]